MVGAGRVVTAGHELVPDPDLNEYGTKGQLKVIVPEVDTQVNSNHLSPDVCYSPGPPITLTL
tara:strand:- start:16 stop:201 length:186 start_codon:yes stop_codon:yes gene_type:complete